MFMLQNIQAKYEYMDRYDHDTCRRGSYPGGGKCHRFQEKRILCVSPKTGPAQPAAPSKPYI